MIQLRNITLDVGNTRIFTDINCVLQRGDRVGFIGRNGAGKSTLLKVIAGLIEPTSGQISIEKGAKIAYLAQEDIISSTLGVFEEALSAFKVLFETEKKIARIETAITDGTATQEALEEYAELQIVAKSYDRYEAIKQTQEVLAGLGFTDELQQKTVNQLSTGWKMRLALVKLLLTDADMYLFDEPTNHLDIVTQQWFLQKLQSMPQGFLLVSHDRAYLEKVCNCILEIERGRATYHRGNLQSYLQAKDQQLAVAISTRARQEREIAHKQAMADRFRASASRAQQAKNLMKQIERIDVVEVEKPLATINFHFPVPQRPGETVVTFTNLAYEFNAKKIFESASGEIQRGERVALVAANGVGKTTLLNCITGRYTPLRGKVKFGHNVTVAFFEQDQARVLDPEKTIFQEVVDSCKIAELEIRKLLGSFQFSGDDVYKKNKVLSGGEKNRVAMVKVLLQRANFLILDEPTNHLDLYAKDVLCQALSAYEGTMLFVSHDLDFVSKLATKVIELTPDGAYSYPGSYDDFVLQKQAQQAAGQSVEKIQKKEKATATDEKKELRKQSADLEKFIARLERDEKRAIDVLSSHPYGSKEYTKALQQFEQVKKQLEQALLEWEAVQLKLT